MVFCAFCAGCAGCAASSPHLTQLVAGCSLWNMPVDSLVDEVVDEVDNKSRAVRLRGTGMTLEQIGQQLGITKQGVAKLLKNTHPTSLPVARMEAVSRTLAELAESTRAAGAEVFEMGLRRAKRRMKEVEAGDDDAAAQAVLATAKISTEGARIIHGWGETNGTGAGGRVSIGIIGDLRGLMKSNPAQVVEVQEVTTNSGIVDDVANHQQTTEQA